MRILLFISFMLLACVSEQKRASVAGLHQHDTLQQGIQGKVLWLEGNMMPTIVEDSQQVKDNTGTPVERQVFIYQLTHQNQAKKEAAFYTDISTPLVKKVETDAEGRFQVYLEPGRYSLFVKEPQGWYANLFDEKGYIHPVSVSKDSLSRVILKVDYKAFY